MSIGHSSRVTHAHHYSQEYISYCSVLGTLYHESSELKSNIMYFRVDNPLEIRVIQLLLVGTSN